ncbi:glycosyltransferase family 2 protein [Geomonas sp. RF6]|uniref:glycosyltransferase family 2 protein n=1 Tax=Geomonas sp. RF6 TaxID=2897342 RepID=UPI001E5F491D|nr:glycosyltransferase family 2 protein [Geomonas sp. RF6]UFS69717.1 glycosyltransferase family 2 protein [Geomonas sp. RF6]
MSVYVVLVNYNGWEDTVACLDSLFRSDYPRFRVLVCDNGSGDGSLDKIAQWAEGGRSLPPARRGTLARLHHPPRVRALPFARYDRRAAESGGEVGEEAPLVLIDCGENLGFAGGNNVALRYALARGDFDHAWLLNNDTVVEPDAMRAMAARLAESAEGGLCAATLLHYHDPSRVQALGGGWYCKWLGLAWHLGRLSRWPARPDRDRIERLLHYPVGASMMVSKGFLEEVGLLCEEYFLYFEELDWVLRAAGRYGVVYAPESVVYHKVGASVGTSSNPAAKSAACDYWNARNRIFFTRRWFPEALPTVYLGLLGTLAVRLLLGKWDRAAMLLRLLCGGEDARPVVRPG